MVLLENAYCDDPMVMIGLEQYRGNMALSNTKKKSFVGKYCA